MSKLLIGLFEECTLLICVIIKVLLDVMIDLKYFYLNLNIFGVSCLRIYNSLSKYVEDIRWIIIKV